MRDDCSRCPLVPCASRSPRPTVDDFSECFTEVIRQERVQDRIDTGIHVGHHLTHDLDHDTRVGDLILVNALQDQDDLQPGCSFI
jgi:hypothetical protein